MQSCKMLNCFNLSRSRYIQILFFVLVGVGLPASAQWDAQISQYWISKTYYNPAFAGETENLQASALHRQQWVAKSSTVKIDNAPRTTLVTANMPYNFFGRTHGLGVVFMNESLGAFNNTFVAAQYAYKKKIKNNVLNLGVQLGMLNIGFDAGDIIIPPDQQGGIEIPATTGDASSSLDIGVGASWIGPKYYIGLGMMHATEPSFELSDTYSSFVVRSFYLSGGYNIEFRNPLYELQPSFLVKSDGVLTQYEVTARMVYNKFLNGGVSWRKDDGFVFSLGLRYKAFDFGYAYDLSTSEIAKVSGGTHEIFLRYSTPIKLGNTKKKGHKSVRIL